MCLVVWRLRELNRSEFLAPPVQGSLSYSPDSFVPSVVIEETCGAQDS